MQLVMVSIRYSRPTNRCSRIATAPFFKHTLLAKAAYTGADLARPQSAKLWALAGWKNAMNQLSEGMSFIIVFLLVGGVAFLIYQMDRRVKNQGTLFPKSASPKTRFYALLAGLLIGSFAFINWFTALPLSWLLFIIALALIGYSLGQGQPLAAIQAEQLRSLPLFNSNILRLSFGLLGLFVMIILFTAMGGLVGALFGMLVAVIARANGFMGASVGAIIGAVVLTVEFMNRLEQSKIIKVVAGVIAGALAGVVVGLSYGGIWLIGGASIGLVGGIIGVVTQKRYS